MGLEKNAIGISRDTEVGQNGDIGGWRKVVLMVYRYKRGL